MKHLKSLIFLLIVSAVAIQCTPKTKSYTAESTEVQAGQTLKMKTDVVEEITALSKQKWQWMAEKNVEELANLFDDKSKFVHMSGSWKKERELEIIESGSIWYKDAAVHDVAVEVFGETVVLWNRITLVAHVRGNDVSNEFTVTEVYKSGDKGWKLLDLTFSKVRDTHEIEH